jgi:hypothetical protein
MFNFGKDIVRTLIDYEEGEPFNLPSQVPAIYLYSSQPSMSDAVNGTGAIGGSYTLNYWTEIANVPYKRNYTFPAIPDPSPTSGTNTRGYWEVLRFVRKTGGQTQTIIRQFDVERGAQGDSYPEINTQVLKDIFPGIVSYATDAQLEGFIDIAVEEVKLDILAKGHKWERLFELGKIKLAIAYQTVANIALSQVKEDGDRFFLRYKEFQTRYERMINSLELPVDTNGDNIPDATAQVKPSYAFITR